MSSQLLLKDLLSVHDTSQRVHLSIHPRKTDELKKSYMQECFQEALASKYCLFPKFSISNYKGDFKQALRLESFGEIYLKNNYII